MKAIWKFPLTVARETDLEMPDGARLLTVQVQGTHACAWALVDPDAPIVRRRIAIYGTGWPIPEAPGEYVGTFQSGIYVWHLFDRGEVA